MISKVLSASVIGLDAELIEVEADVTNGLPATVVVGLPDTAVQEARERVKAAVKNSGSEYPQTRVSVNLAPADVPKLGTHFDLPMALAILLANEQIRFSVEGKIFLGELSLDGQLRAVPGVLAVAIKAAKEGLKEIYVPEANAKEAALVEGISVYPVRNLSELLKHLLKLSVVSPYEKINVDSVLKNFQSGMDMKDIAGQEEAKRALEIAAAGSHNVLSFWSQSAAGSNKTKTRPKPLEGIITPSVGDVPFGHKPHLCCLWASSFEALDPFGERCASVLPPLWRKDRGSP